jgi:hypothetical protein
MYMTPPTAPKVPAEFTGKARAFIAHQDRAHRQFLAVISQSIKYYQKHTIRNRHPTTNVLIAVERLLQDVPTAGSLDRYVERTRNELFWQETRLSTTAIRRSDWAEDLCELAIRVNYISYLCNRTGCKLEDDCLYLLGHHAIARFFQRAHDPTESGLYRACQELTTQMDITRINQEEGTFRFNTRSGSWGAAMDLIEESEPAMVVRTYISPEPDAPKGLSDVLLRTIAQIKAEQEWGS